MNDLFYRLVVGGYTVIAWIVWAVVFFSSWWYAIEHYGAFLGVGLGWLPSIFIAVFSAILWPIGALFVLYLYSL